MESNYQSQLASFQKLPGINDTVEPLIPGSFWNDANWLW
jgi:hypothetical protein